jgi:hypothetical protein
VLDHDLRAFLRTGCALIVATVGRDGAPHATRGWGLTEVAATGPLRLILDAGDVVGLEHLSTTGRIAITACDVRTLRSRQLKGRVLGIEPATPEDRRTMRGYCDAFFTDIEQTDGYPRPLLERMVPDELVTCAVEVDELFDQTPGPGAGAKVGGS